MIASLLLMAALAVGENVPGGTADGFFPSALTSSIGDSRVAELAPGIAYGWAKLDGWREKTNEMHVVVIRLGKARTRPFICERAGQVIPFGRPSVSAREKNALFSVNGGFFQWKNPVPYYTHKCGGRSWHADYRGTRIGFAFADDGSSMEIRRLTTNELARTDNFITGDFSLIDGKLCGGALPAKTSAKELAPRTLLGTLAGDRVVVMTVDGRQKGVSDGISYAEGGELLRLFGCDQGFNLDGGGSTVMVIRADALKAIEGRLPPAAHAAPAAPGYLIMNRPSDGRERPILDNLMFIPAANLRP